jgi:signal transduction histidine kinase
VRLRTRLLLALAYVLLLAIVALEIPLALSLRDRVDAEVRSQATSETDVVAASAADLIGAGSTRAGLRSLAISAATTVRGRVLLLDASGRVLTDSAGAAVGLSYASRPEVRAALRGNREQRVRHSSSIGKDLLATAAPVIRRGRVAGAVRVTQSVSSVHRAVRRTIAELALVGVTVLLVGLAAGAFIAAQIARPLKRLERAARSVADGDLDARALEEGSIEQRSLARSFNEMTERLTALVSAQRRFVADASHQLRTPLTGLKLRLEALGNGNASPHVREAAAEVDRLAAIVEELLTLSRAGETPPATARTDLTAAARDAARRFSGSARERGVTLRVTGPAEGAQGWCVRRELDRALDALVENALAYAAVGGEVEIATAPGLVEVRDRGPGPAAGEEEQVFERFHRGRGASAAAPGTGLGLPIARALARGWGGDATLRARPGGGAVAALVVPAHAREEAPA